ncbi:MBL fold metallo-hydrolase [Pseudonocardia kunmingensis]|uniref:Ribonuclease BN (tRNA processing enzyme) n=1 Tax=Pseudonocardia kunmingensis TaxID=630975 RepID=A0A543CXH8_9PSEU|nr:MBL fold metallo-hydrolase [Pseudonocardia kunmingensis]TQM01771.1 ribonuclease BN (tRNA processing enzyme) [Pseudonocardia kunmingensis]
MGRLGIGSALRIGDAVYVIDVGDGAARQLALALDPELTDGHAFEGVRAIFLTHLHSDHVADYFTLLAYGGGRGLGGGGTIPVLGPGRRGALQPAVAQQLAGEPEPPVIHPENPTPGTVDMTRSLMAAFALDLNDRIRDLGDAPLDTLVAPRDIALPPGVHYVPNDPKELSVEPFEVYRDELVTVTATLVSHFPVNPSFGFRFDTPSGAVVFSGDTGPSENLVRLATGADVLVHEVIDPDWIAGRPPAEAQHHRTAHTAADRVGEIAERAGVGRLVLTHIVPGTTPAEKLEIAQQGFSGELVIGSDGMDVGL